MVSELSLSQGTVKITQDNEHLVIADMAILSKESYVKIKEQATEQATEELTAELPDQLHLPKLRLKKFNIHIAINSQQQHKSHPIKIEQLALRHIKANQKMQEGQLTLTAFIDKTRLSLSANYAINFR